MRVFASVFLSVLCLVVPSCSAHSEGPVLWEEPVQADLIVDLLTLGYVIPKAERDVRGYDFLTQSVAFIDEGRVAVSFFKKNDEPGLSMREGTPGSALVFSTVLLDPNTGHLGGQRSWGNAGYWNLFLPLANGNFFVQSYQWLAIYSKEFQEIAKKKVEAKGELLPRYSVSPSGDSIYQFQDIYDTERNWLTETTLLNLLTLEQKQSKLTPGHASETVSDTQVVYTVANSRGKLLLLVYNTDGASTKWSPRLLKKGSAVDELLSRAGCKSPTFINNSVLAITGDCSKLILLESGSKVGEIDSPKYRFGGEIEPSRNGRRFAFVRSQTKSRGSGITTIEIGVYDLEKKREVFTTRVAPLPRLKLAFALSPQGSLLAVQTDSILRVWRLPH